MMVVEPGGCQRACSPKLPAVEEAFAGLKIGPGCVADDAR